MCKVVFKIEEDVAIPFEVGQVSTCIELEGKVKIYYHKTQSQSLLK